MTKVKGIAVQVHQCEADADELGLEDGPCPNTDTRRYSFKDPGSWNGAEYAYDMSFWLCANCHTEVINQDY